MEKSNMIDRNLKIFRFWSNSVPTCGFSSGYRFLNKSQICEMGNPKFREINLTIFGSWMKAEFLIISFRVKNTRSSFRVHQFNTISVSLFRSYPGELDEIHHARLIAIYIRIAYLVTFSAFAMASAIVHGVGNVFRLHPNKSYADKPVFVSIIFPG